MSAPTAPLAPSNYAELPAIAGVTIAAAAAGVRYQNRLDVMVMRFDEGTQAAGVFTNSLTASAPVLAGRAALKASGKARVLVVNSGNSNAFTGKAGEASLARVRAVVCALAGCSEAEFFMASTGVIGEKLPDEKITAALPNLFSSLSATNWNDAAKAIMTTDTFPKMATRTAMIDGVKVTLNGIAKGSGMIAPDMATMLAFVATDANIPSAILQTMLSEATAQTFNCITVDGDTSTSDSLMVFATGKAANITNDLSEFKTALTSLLHELALYVVKDGEGAEKLITIKITGAENDAAAKRIGMSIANSPLVKTALAASDANWGRIVMAVGKAGEKANRDQLCITIGGVSVAKNGEADPDYREADIAAHMQGRDIMIDVDVGIHSGSATIYTCDLTHRYIDINGSYRT